MCLAMMGPGDTAIVPAPYFPIHVYSVALASGNVIALEVRDSEKFLANIAYTCEHLYPRPKLLIVNYPHNPSTVCIEQSFFDEVVKLARKYGFVVISDFAYADIAFDGYKPPSFLASPGAADVGVEFTTMSKGYNMAGWRVGFCAGNRQMIKALATIKGYYDYGMFQAVQIAAIMALRNGDAGMEQQAAIYESRRDALVESLRPHRLAHDAPQSQHVLLGAHPRALALAHEHDGLRHDAPRKRQRRRQPRQRLRPRRRRLSADVTGRKRSPPPPSRAANSKMPPRCGRAILRQRRSRPVRERDDLNAVKHFKIRTITISKKVS